MQYAVRTHIPILKLWNYIFVGFCCCPFVSFVSFRVCEWKQNNDSRALAPLFFQCVIRQQKSSRRSGGSDSAFECKSKHVVNIFSLSFGSHTHIVRRLKKIGAFILCVFFSAARFAFFLCTNSVNQRSFISHRLFARSRSFWTRSKRKKSNNLFVYFFLYSRFDPILITVHLCKYRWYVLNHLVICLLFIYTRDERYDWNFHSSIFIGFDSYGDWMMRGIFMLRFRCNSMLKKIKKNWTWIWILKSEIIIGVLLFLCVYVLRS